MVPVEQVEVIGRGDEARVGGEGAPLRLDVVSAEGERVVLRGGSCGM